MLLIRLILGGNLTLQSGKHNKCVLPYQGEILYYIFGYVRNICALYVKNLLIRKESG